VTTYGRMSFLLFNNKEIAVIIHMFSKMFEKNIVENMFYLIIKASMVQIARLELYNI